MMNRDLERIVEGVKKIRFPVVGKEYEPEDIDKVWRAVGQFIRNHLFQNKAVIVPNVGLFTLNQVKIPLSHHPVKYLFNQTPIFHLANSVASNFKIKSHKKHVEGARPQVTLNLCMLASYCQMSRCKVEICIREVITYTQQRLCEGRSIRLPFVGVGVLKISGEHFRMDFEKEFYDQICERDVIRVVTDRN